MKTIKEYWENGNIKSEKYLDGDEFVPLKTWYECGQQEFEFPNKDGTLHGVNRAWLADGTLRYEYTFRDGLLHGIERHWSSDEELLVERPWYNSFRHGITKHYDVGTVRYVYHLEGKCVSAKQYRRHQLILALAGVSDKI